MPITVERDPARRWLVVTATGEITIDDLLELLRTARAPIELRMWPMLFDATGATTSMTAEDIDRAVELVRTTIASTGPRGHVALVADDNSSYSALLMYEIRCAEIGVRFIRVFRQRSDAERWLAVMSAARNLL
jgi:hypothetical protein